MLNCLLLTSVVLLGQVQDAEREENGAELASQVRRLVIQLDDDELARRVAAEKKLLSLGPAVLDVLPPITARTPAEAKQRLTRVRKALEIAAGEAATTATHVTLQGKMSLAEAFAALQKQTGNRVVGIEGRQAEIQVDFNKTLYWQALDEVLDQAGLNIDLNQFDGPTNALAVVARPDEQLPRIGMADYSGVFRFEATRVEASRNLRIAAISGMRLAVEIAWEPRVSPISITQPLDQIALTDENGDTLPLDDNLGAIQADVQSGSNQIELLVPLKLPPRRVKQIALLKGKITAMVPGRVETFRFTGIDKAKNAEQQRGGATVVLEQVRKNVDLYEVRVRLRFDEAANAFETHQGWIYNNQAYLIDPDGKKHEPFSNEGTRLADNEVGLAYLFDLENGPAGFTFVYKTPAAMVKKTIPYELKNIELP